VTTHCNNRISRLSTGIVSAIDFPNPLVDLTLTIGAGNERSASLLSMPSMEMANRCSTVFVNAGSGSDAITVSSINSLFAGTISVNAADGR